jgi:MFS family permease
MRSSSVAASSTGGTVPPMRKTTVAVAALFFTNGAAFASWAPRIPEIADRIGVDIAGLGFTLLMVGIGGLVGTPLSGLLIDRLTSRVVATIGAVVVSLLLVGIGVTTNPIILGAVLFLVGVFDVGADLGMNAQAVSVQTGGPSLINRFHGLWSVGTVFGGGVGAAAAGAGMSLQLHFSLVAVVMAAVSLWAGAQLIPTDPAPPVLPDGQARPNRRPLLVLAVLGFFAAFIETPGNEWAATFIDAEYSATPAVAALGFVAFTAGMTISRLGGDAVALRVGGRRGLRLSLILASVGWLIAVLSPSAVASIAGLAMAGLGTGMLFPELYATSASGAVVSQGRGLSSMSLGARLGFLLATPAIGLGGAAFGLSLTIGALVATSIVGTAVLSIRSSPPD